MIILLYESKKGQENRQDRVHVYYILVCIIELKDFRN